MGAGLFGQVIARHLLSKGHDVLVMDDRRELSGSKPAACLMKPGWASKMSRAEYEDALRLLNDHYGVLEIPFLFTPLKGIQKTVTLHWCRPRSILTGVPVSKVRVLAVQCGNAQRADPLVTWCLPDGTRCSSTFKRVIVCTGVWAEELVPSMRGLVTGKGGWAFTWKGSLAANVMRGFTPYRQVIGFNRDDGEIWASDGTTLGKLSFGSCGTMARPLERCASLLGKWPVTEADHPTVIAGYRPYMDIDKPAGLFDCGWGVTVCTGGAKNGTLGAAWCARQLERTLT